MASYEKQWSSANPGLLIIMLDQSGSMEGTYQDGETKAEFAAKAVNKVIQSIIDKNFSGTTPKDRCFIAVIGYETEAALLANGMISQFASNPLKTLDVSQKMSDGAGGIIEVPKKMPVWFEAKHGGVTNMASAFKIATEIINEYFAASPDSPAPVIINISDGVPCIWNGSDTVYDLEASTKMAKSLMSMSCSDGNVLLFNAHIEANSFNVQLPASESELPSTGDGGAKFLFDISSVIPEGYKGAAEKSGLNVKDNSRGCMIGCDAEGLVKLIDFGSSKGLNDIKAN